VITHIDNLFEAHLLEIFIIIHLLPVLARNLYTNLLESLISGADT